MDQDSETKTLGKVVSIDEARIQDHLGELVRGTVEETLNAMLDAEADAMCGAQRYERSPDRIDTRAGHYDRKFHTKVYKHIETWRNRPIEGEYPYVYLDGIVLKRSWAGEIKNVSVLVAIGVDQDGYRTILGVQEGHKEDKSGWSGFLEHLKSRGLKGVRLVISDACMGLIESVADYYPDADWQRCTVHFYRNVFSHVPRNKTRVVAAMLKAIHAQESREAAQEKAGKVVGELRRMRLAKAAELVESKIDQTLAYYAYPPTHWIKLRTNNPMERIMREIRRRTRVVGAFPDGESAVMLVGARLRHIASTSWGTRKYMSMDWLKQQDMEAQRTA